MSTKKKTKKKPSKKTSAQKSTKRFNIKRLLMWATTLGIWGCLVLGAILAYYAYDLPNIDNAMEVERRPGLTLLSADGQILATSGDLYGEAVQLRDLPDHVPQAIMATEDRRFYDHFGIDVIGLARAMVTNLAAGRIRQGGSTLSRLPKTCSCPQNAPSSERYRNFCSLFGWNINLPKTRFSPSTSTEFTLEQGPMGLNRLHGNTSTNPRVRCPFTKVP